jgi:2-aminoethylphosphonate transport system permease protein
VLAWSRSGRIVAWTAAAILAGVIFVAPLAVIVAASFSSQWNGVLPSQFTLAKYGSALTGAAADQIRVSILTGAVASGLALLLGTAAGLGLRQTAGPSRRALDLLFFMPSAVPSVSVGLGLLVAFSQPPLLLNGTTTIVIIAHLVLVSAFSYGNVAAGLAHLPPDYEQMAESLGARSFYRLWHVTLPLITPYLLSAFSLSFALSMGELGATVMVYPPGWVTMPVGIFALTDRGDVLTGATLTVVLVAVTLIVLGALALVPNRAAHR